MRTQIGHFEYEIDDNNVVSIWDLEHLNSDVPGTPPNIRQNFHPDGVPWEDADTAKAWAEAYIDEMLNPPAPVTPAE